MIPNNYQWFITAILDRTCSRTFGFYGESHEAREAVFSNRCDMQECLYRYIVIEKMKEGIHPMAEEELWFEWIQTGTSEAGFEIGKWVTCDKPKEFEGTINWALG